MALLPVQQRDPVLQLSFTHMVDAAQQRVIVLVGAPTWPDAKHAADAYVAVLAGHPGVITQSAMNDQVQQDWMALFFAHRSVLISKQQREQLAHPETANWTDTALRRLYSPFAGPQIGAWRDDPYGVFSNWVQERAQETPVRPRDGYLFVERDNRQYVLLSLTVHDSVFALHTQQVVTRLLDQAASAAKANTANVELITAGVILHAAAAGQQASGEVWTIGLGSLLGIIVLMWATFHSLKPIVLILLSIAIGCLGALSICWLWFGQIHLLTLVFGASLIGVAQDYGIFFLCQRMHAAPTLDSVSLLKRLMPSLKLTLVAAVIGYMGLAFTPFPGLRNMAVFSALGLLFAWLTVVCWFPSLVDAKTLKSGKLAHWFGRTLAIWPIWKNRLRDWLPAFGLLLVVVLGISQLGANDDIRLLQNSPPKLISDQIKLSQLLDAPTPVQFFLVRAASEQALLEQEELLKARLDPLIMQKKISGYQAISNWVPSQKTQLNNLALQDFPLYGSALGELAKPTGEDQQWVSDIRAHFLEAGQLLSVDQFMRSPASEPWRHLWLGKVSEGYASIVALRGLTQAAVPDLQRAVVGLPHVQWVDKVAEISSVLGQYRHFMGVVLLCAYVAVFGLLFTRYRRQTWRVLLPAALATLITLSVLGWTHQPLQLFHVLGFMLLLGIGVDYGIFMQESSRSHAVTAWLAIGLSAVNTLLSFGLLGLSNTPALQSFGIAMLIGIAAVWVIVPIFRKVKNDQN